MSDERAVHPDCRNASNPYHECSDYCFRVIAEAIIRMQKQESEVAQASGGSSQQQAIPDESYPDEGTHDDRPKPEEDSASDPDQEEMAPLQPPAPLTFYDSIDSLLNVFAWYRSEFAASNAIIDALCTHLQHLSAYSSDYDSALGAIECRRLYWNPVIKSQKYHSIADVNLELGRAFLKKTEFSGSKEMHQSSMSNNVFPNQEGLQQIKLIQGFKAEESVEGNMVNVVDGLKLYEDVFSESEICKLNNLVKDIHAAGKDGELSGQTFVLFNKQLKGNKTEFIQLGVPIFEQIIDDTSNIEPIPLLLHEVIDHLIESELISGCEYLRPNGCIISFFEKGGFSQPFLKPPHLENPLITLLLSESTMAFGHIIKFRYDGDYRGSLKLSLKKGSLLVMRRNSADVARHVMCSSGNSRVSITFFRVKPVSPTSTSSMTTAMTHWQPAIASPSAVPNGILSGYAVMYMMPGFLGPPMVWPTPTWPMALNPGELRDGTGVSVPWQGQSTRQTRNVPPCQQGGLMELPSPIESHMEETASESGITDKE